jgi:iron complex transport system substrate-binding protein
MFGAGNRIVALDATSSYSPEVREKPQLGYCRNLSAEGILALVPDLLLAPHAGPDVVLDQVRAAGVRIAQTPDVKTLAELPAKVLFVGKALGLEQEAADVAKKLRAEIAALAEKRPELVDPPGVLFIISIQDGAPLAAGEGTAPDEVIEAGGMNVAAFDGFNPMSAEAVIAAAPDLLLMTSEHAETLGGAEAVLDRPSSP